MDAVESSSGIDAVRDVYERALTAVGLHLTEVGKTVYPSFAFV